MANSTKECAAAGETTVDKSAGGDVPGEERRDRDPPDHRQIYPFSLTYRAICSWVAAPRMYDKRNDIYVATDTGGEQ